MRASLLMLPALVLAGAAEAQVSRVSAADFNAAAGVITFSEYPVNTVNPTFLPAQYGGGTNAPTVFTGGYFTGQRLSTQSAVDCPGAAASACVVGMPTGPLTLDPGSPSAFITTDSSTPTSPVLSGRPQYNGPISILFSTDQVAVGFNGGFFDAARSTGIVAYDRSGNVLGTIPNMGTGIEFLGIGSTDNVARIAGVGLRLVGNEPFGFVIDNLRFGVAGQVTVPGSDAPEPASWAMMLVGFGAIGCAMRRKAARTRIAFS